jgi:hypothetical protein
MHEWTSDQVSLLSERARTDANSFVLSQRRTHFPNKDIYYPNEPIEAECRATGMPLPTVEWVHGTGSFIVSTFFCFFIDDDF